MLSRTPDEIKKGLKCCNRTFDACHECPYDTVDEGWGCTVAKNADALALIQQLQKENAEQGEKIRVLEARVQRFEAERNAAVADMAEIIGCPCGVCKHYLKDGRKEPCNSCRNIRRGEESHFEWRGVQKEGQPNT